MSALQHSDETTFLNAWMQAGACVLGVAAEASVDISNLRIGLLDVAYVLKTGIVVRSDMLEDKGLWEVVGHSVDGLDLQVRLVISSADCNLKVLRVKKVSGRSKR